MMFTTRIRRVGAHIPPWHSEGHFVRIIQRQRRYASDINSSSTRSQTRNARYVSRIQRMNDKLPKFLRHYTIPLLSAPVSHITAFLVLHEITALVPLVGLAALFHYSNWLPEQIVSGQWVQAGVEKWGRYFQRKGWVENAGSPDSVTTTRSGTSTKSHHREESNVDVDEVKSRGAGWNVVLEVATAWAVVKALLPVRIVGSVWMTPWFARIAIVPAMRLFSRAGSKVV